MRTGARNDNRTQQVWSTRSELHLCTDMPLKLIRQGTLQQGAAPGQACSLCDLGGFSDHHLVVLTED